MAISEPMRSGHSVGDAEGIIIAADASVCEMLQRTPRELIGLSYLDITHGDDRASSTRMLDALPVDSAPVTIYKRYLRPDGVAVPVELMVSRFTTDERQGRLVCTLRWHAAGTLPSVSDPLWRTARRIVALSTLRKRILGPDLFPDHPLGILLHTYIAEMEGRTVTPRELSQVLEASPTPILRWIAALGTHGLVDTLAGLDAPLQLTDAGVSRLEHLLRAAA